MDQLSSYWTDFLEMLCWEHTKICQYSSLVETEKRNARHFAQLSKLVLYW